MVDTHLPRANHFQQQTRVPESIHSSTFGGMFSTWHWGTACQPTKTVYFCGFHSWNRQILAFNVINSNCAVGKLINTSALRYTSWVIKSRTLFGSCDLLANLRAPGICRCAQMTRIFCLVVGLSLYTTKPAI